MFFSPSEPPDELYILGNKFRRIAKGLDTTGHGKSLEPADREYLHEEFEYIGNLIAEIDFESRSYTIEKHPELASEARQVYPFFYQTLHETTTDREIGFSEKIYRLLKAGDGKADLSLEDISKIGEVMLFMSVKCCDECLSKNERYSRASSK
jgi:hypothetical protein